MTLNEKFTNICLDFPEREAMRVKTSSGWVIYQYKDLLASSRRVAGWLQSQGFLKGDRAAIIFDNSPRWSIVYFGILLAGGMAVPLDPQASHHDLVTFVEDSQPSFVFLENRLLETLLPQIRRVKAMVVMKREKMIDHCFALDDILARPSLKDQSFAISIEGPDTASLLYSSGTTANPKGIELTHDNFYANFLGIDRFQVCHDRDIFISILPLFHAYSFMATLIYPLFIGAKIIYPGTLKSAELISIIKDTNVTIMVGVPELFYAIHRTIVDQLSMLSVPAKMIIKILTDISWYFRKTTRMNLAKILYHALHEKFGKNLRLLVSGGARLEPRVATDFERFGFTILEGYGLTETAPIVTLNPPQKIKIGSVGKPIFNAEVKIVDPNSEGVGEIIIRGPSVMKGYFQKPDETDQIMKEGWFYSGDLGILDKDGYLYIRGRSKEVIVLGSGKNVFPDEIERYYARSKFIKEVGVFLSELDGKSMLKGIVVPNFEAFKKGGQVNVMEKIRWDFETVSKELSAYKRVLGFVLSKEELPRTRLGKIKRYLLPQIYLKESKMAEAENIPESSTASDALLGSPLGRRIVEFLKSELKLERPLRGQDHLELDLGVDSLARVEITVGLEKLLFMRFADNAFHDVGTVSELITKINTLMQKASLDDGSTLNIRASWKEIILSGYQEKDFENLLVDRDTRYRIMGQAARAAIWLFLKTFGFLKVYGKENLPKEGPYIICPNHASYLDAFVVVAGISRQVMQKAYFIGLKDIFDHPLIHWSIKPAKVIPIDPAVELVRAMQAAGFILKQNKILCIFPEGARSVDGEVKTFKKGVGILVRELNISVVPAYIEGSYESWPRAQKYPKPHRMKIIFGKPIDFSQRAEISSRLRNQDEIYKVIADDIRSHVLKLRDSLQGLPGRL